MKLTKAKAKKISVEVWTYLAEHPEIFMKSDLPKKLYNQIENHLHRCPLCELFKEKETAGYEIEYKKNCKHCPLWNCSQAFYAARGCACRDYLNWENGLTCRTRAKYAAIIRDKIKEW